MDKDRRLGSVAVRALTKRYGGQFAVSGVSLEVAAGEFVSLIGPSGSGKTTTLMMIAGFARPDEGQILLDGADITQLSPQKRQLGMVFQNYAIFPHLTVFENVAFPLRVRGESQAAIAAKVGKALEVVKLEGFAGRYSQQLSGGQQQRVALARAIVFQPRIILMDEPLGALDKNLRYHMQTELKELQRSLGTTVIYVTHDQEEAMNMSDRIVVMDKGGVEQIGAPAAVYNRPETPFVARFLGEANMIAVALEQGKARSAAGLDWCAAADARAPRSGPAQIFIRPEKVRIDRHGDIAGENRFTGTIIRVSFLGNITRYAIDIGEREPLTVDEQNLSADAACRSGERIGLTVHARDALVLPS